MITIILHAYLDFPWVVSVVEEQKSFKEYPRKKAATAMDPNTTATHPTRRSQVWDVVASPKYFQPCKLVRLQNSSKVIIFAKLLMSVVFIIDRFRSKVGSLFCYEKEIIFWSRKAYVCFWWIKTCNYPESNLIEGCFV